MMIYGLVMAIHILLSLFLIVIILLQGGRGGLGETLGGAAAQSLFGGGANTVMTKITAVCAGLFMVTCLSLAILSTARGRSVIEQLPITSPEQLPLTLPHAPENLPQPAATTPKPREHAPQTPQPSVPTNAPAPSPEKTQ